ncbi:hypothetical protein KBX06_13560 [Micromonospora sp. C31]|uniref:hypothetical protein n=1 Tax=Micromonospora sp. C31 TaxID=2824876 RepID=UPI001B39C49C|nr:hypothetical protein [Micromonospora sp. C31]MBQ1074178.1 hypothetical protein [Micromonospora sp. C31]
MIGNKLGYCPAQSRQMLWAVDVILTAPAGTAGIERLSTPEARAFADERRAEYLDGYRDVVGFGWLILAPA